MKAYQVTNHDGDEEPGVIVFAETASKAKSLAHHGEGFDCEWTDMAAKRLPSADQYATQINGTILFWHVVAHRRIYRNLGWRMFEAETCDSCNRFEDDQIPESRRVECAEGELCADCLQKASEAGAL